MTLSDFIDPIIVSKQEAKEIPRADGESIFSTKELPHFLGALIGDSSQPSELPSQPKMMPSAKGYAYKNSLLRKQLAE
ncbi:hypothetical protein KIN20_023924 [Parelaphostrongylus tenuis]|uniref:Uncharacterized protein n=1 Tax=Parelaphostrongylus tenuis TaxID=148309 RepID=A0AAD5QWE8_PARTN|nr:hypothetical protein KIN20_023924 [Parelaphostrongylus tenuis]